MTNWGRTPPAGARPRFGVGARVLWHRGNGKTYPATVLEANWYRRSAEPWGYMIRLDATPDTARFSHMLRFPGESKLSPEEGTCAS